MGSRLLRCPTGFRIDPGAGPRSVPRTSTSVLIVPVVGKWKSCIPVESVRRGLLHDPASSHLAYPQGRLTGMRHVPEVATSRDCSADTPLLHMARIAAIAYEGDVAVGVPL